jgi:hypothetical protein
MPKNNGCAYGQVTREMVTDIRDDLKGVKESIEKLDEKVTDIYNHQSNRLPLWATILMSLLVGLVSLFLGIILK